MPNEKEKKHPLPNWIEHGKRIVNISKLLDIFEAQEGELHHVIGKTGMGKTYFSTWLAWKFLRQGKVVYTTWQLILPAYYDEREHWWPVIRNLILFRKNFYRFDLAKNWHYVDVERPDLIEYVAGLTDCILMMDEGQDVYDSRERATRQARQSITRMRHMRKTIYIISQRAQAVDVTARANVTFFYKCVKKWSWPVPYFKVYYTEETDNESYPQWVTHNSQGDITWHAPVFHTGWARRSIYKLYNSWYLREGKEKTQEVHFEAFRLTTWDKILVLFRKNPRIRAKKVLPVPERSIRRLSPPPLDLSRKTSQY